MFYDRIEQGVLLRVRLTPNSSSCSIKGIFTDAHGNEYLKINVISVPEKGKANQELQNFLAKKLGLAKSQVEIVYGETDRYKKVLLCDKSDQIIHLLQKWAEEG